MAVQRKQHTAAFKAHVDLAALQGARPINELASQFAIHPTLIHGWKKHLLAEATQLFARAGGKDNTSDVDAGKAELFEQIGRLKMELEWLKKKFGPVC